jgi:hypothetical protein
MAPAQVALDAMTRSVVPGRDRALLPMSAATRQALLTPIERLRAPGKKIKKN